MSALLWGRLVLNFGNEKAARQAAGTRTSETVVQEGIRGLRRKKVVVVPGLVYRSVRPFLNSRVAQRLWRQLTKRR